MSPKPQAAEPSQPSIGAFFRRLREAQGLSQTQLARESERYGSPVSQSAISAIEVGRVVPTVDTLVALSKTLHIDPSEALELVPHDDEIGSASGDVYALRDRGRAELQSGRFREALRTFAEIEAGLEVPASPAATRLAKQNCVNQAVACRRLGAYRSARAAAERAIGITSDDIDTHVRAYVVLAGVLSWTGEHELAEVIGSRGVELADDASDDVQADALIQLASVMYRQNDVAAALEIYRKAGELSTDPRRQSRVHGNTATCLHDLGDIDGARAMLDRAYDLAQAAGEEVLAAGWKIEQGVLDLEAGDSSRARAAGGDAAIVATRIGDDLLLFRARWLELRSGRDDADVQRQLQRLHRRLRSLDGWDPIREYAAWRDSKDA